jgi:hypothetical protein
MWPRTTAAPRWARAAPSPAPVSGQGPGWVFRRFQRIRRRHLTSTGRVDLCVDDVPCPVIRRECTRTNRSTACRTLQSVATRGRIIRGPLSAMNRHLCGINTIALHLCLIAASGSGRKRPESLTLRARKPARVLLPPLACRIHGMLISPPMFETRRDAIEGRVQQRIRARRDSPSEAASPADLSTEPAYENLAFTFVEMQAQTLKNITAAFVRLRGGAHGICHE